MQLTQRHLNNPIYLAAFLRWSLFSPNSKIYFRYKFWKWVDWVSGWTHACFIVQRIFSSKEFRKKFSFSLRRKPKCWLAAGILGTLGEASAASMTHSLSIRIHNYSAPRLLAKNINLNHETLSMLLKIESRPSDGYIVRGNFSK